MVLWVVARGAMAFCVAAHWYLLGCFGWMLGVSMVLWVVARGLLTGTF